jgi:hypothetical protein
MRYCTGPDEEEEDGKEVVGEEELHMGLFRKGNFTEKEARVGSDDGCEEGLEKELERLSFQ